MTNEVFKLFHQGPQNYYYIGNMGTVKSLEIKTLKTKDIKQAIRKTGKHDRQGYYIIGLNFNGKNKQFYVHRLVAKYFCSKSGPKDGFEVNHIDGNKHNNAISNLEWVTRQANALHAHRLGLIKKADVRGEKNPNYGNRKYSTALIDYALDLISKGESLSSAARITGVDNKNLWRYKKVKGVA